MHPRVCAGIASARPATTGLYFLVLMEAKPSAVILIDNSNFYHSLKEAKYLPFSHKFDLLFKEIEAKFAIKEIRIYDATKDRIKDPNGYAKQQRFYHVLSKSTYKPKIRTRQLRYIVSISEQEVIEEGKKLGIVDSCKNLLYKLLMRLNLIRLTKEKGIDVLLVADAVEIARAKKSDYIAILSGDADFVPAINLIKAYGVKTLNLHLYYGSSNELRNACDKHALITMDATGQPKINWYL